MNVWHTLSLFLMKKNMQQPIYGCGVHRIHVTKQQGRWKKQGLQCPAGFKDFTEAMELGQAGNQDYLMFNIRGSTDMK